MHSEKIVRLTHEVPHPLEHVWKTFSQMQSQTALHHLNVPFRLHIVTNEFKQSGKLFVQAQFYQSGRIHNMAGRYHKIDCFRYIICFSINGKRMVFSLNIKSPDRTKITLSHEMDPRSSFEKESILTQNILLLLTNLLEEQQTQLSK